MKIYIYTTILIAICFAVYILIYRKYKNSRPDTKTEIQRNLSSQTIGNLLQTDSSGNLSVIPAPLVDQRNYLLTGKGNWAPVIINSYQKTTASGKQSILFKDIPAYVNRITIMLSHVKINSAAVPVAQIGANTTIQTTNYFSVSTYIGPNSGNGSFGNGWYVTPNSGVNTVRHGNYYITHIGGNEWTCTGSFAANDNYISFCGGSVKLSGVLDRVSLSTSDGTSIFTDGSVNILYE